MPTIKDLPVNGRAKVVGYGEHSRAYRSKLFSMGLTKGAVLTVKRVAPFGDPVEIEVRGTMTSLRKQEAEALLIEEVPHEV